MELIILTFIIGFILFLIVFSAVKQAVKPILEYIDELKGNDTPTDIGLLIDLRDNSVIEPSELTELVNYRNDTRINSINSSKFKRVEALLKEMRDLEIYDDESFEKRLIAVKQFYGIKNSKDKISKTDTN